MQLGFHSYNSNDNCSICLESMTGDRNVVAHDGSHGEKHPLHKECIKQCLMVKSDCPVCRVSLNTNSLFSWKEGVTNELTHITNDAFKGAKVGSYVPAPAVAAGVVGAVVVGAGALVGAAIGIVGSEGMVGSAVIVRSAGVVGGTAAAGLVVAGCLAEVSLAELSLAEVAELALVVGVGATILGGVVAAGSLVKGVIILGSGTVLAGGVIGVISGLVARRL